MNTSTSFPQFLKHKVQSVIKFWGINFFYSTNPINFDKVTRNTNIFYLEHTVTVSIKGSILKSYWWCHRHKKVPPVTLTGAYALRKTHFHFCIVDKIFQCLGWLFSFLASFFFYRLVQLFSHLQLLLSFFFWPPCCYESMSEMHFVIWSLLVIGQNP